MKFTEDDQIRQSLAVEPKSGADNYDLREEIAHGGMATIIEAVDIKFQRTVAAKLMSLDADADERIRHRFLREVRILAMLEHPNIVPIHDIVWEQGQPLFYTMKMVKGRSLETVLNELGSGNEASLKEFPLDRLLTVFDRICEAVAFAHSQKVIHRDLKPSNIMVGQFGEVMVMDWGVAKILGEADEDGDQEGGAHEQAPVVAPWHTMSGSVVGTPCYMSPEQAHGQVDERSDIFSLGGILQAILMGHAPGPVHSPLRTGSSNPSSLMDGGRVPAALAAVAQQALAPDPARRYSRVLDLSRDIDAYRAGHATKAELAGPGRKLWLLVRRHRALAVVLGAMLALSAVFIVRLVASEGRARASAGAATTSAAQARQALGQARIALAEAAYQDLDSPGMLASLGAVPEDLRDSTWRYLRRRADTSWKTIPLPDGQFGVSCAPHPRKPGVFAVAVSPNRILTVDVKAGSILSDFPVSPTQQRSERFYGLGYSPDGEKLIVGGHQNTSVAIYQAETGQLLAEWESPVITSSIFSPDGTRTLESIVGSTRMRDATDGRILWSAEIYSHPCFTPEGDVIGASPDSGVFLFSGQDGRVLKTIYKRHIACVDSALTPDGKFYFVADMGSRVQGLRVADGAVIFDRVLSNNKWCKPRLAISADGITLVAGVADAGGHRRVTVWDLHSGTLLRSLLGGSGLLESISIHPLSHEILLTGPDLRVWPLQSRQPGWKLPSDLNSCAFLGDDDTFLSWDGLETLLPGGNYLHAPGNDPQSGIMGSKYVRATGSGGNTAVISERQSMKIHIIHRNGGACTVQEGPPISFESEIVRMSRDGRFAAVLCREINQMVTFNTESGQLLPECSRPGTTAIRDVCWLKDGKLAGICTRGVRGGQDAGETLILWDSATGQILRSEPGTCRMQTLASAPDGNTFAEAGDNKMIRLRDASTLAILQEFRAHDDLIRALAFHPTRPVLASASADLTLRIWDLRDGSLMEELSPDEKGFDSLSFSPTGKRLAASTSLDRVMVWDWEDRKSP